MAKKKQVSVNKKNSSGLKSLKLLITIVNKSKSIYYLDLLEQFEINVQMVVSGKGTANSQMLNILGLSESEKVVILSFVREDRVDEVLEVLNEKFKVIKNGKGIAYTIPFQSVIGVYTYQLLSNSKVD